MSRLNVELYGVTLGTLVQAGRSVRFDVDPDVFERYPVASTVMSLAVPLGLRPTAQHNKRAANFFNELLPEGRNLQWLVQMMPPDERNTYHLLRKYGRDSVGALIIYDPDDPVSSEQPRAEKISAEQTRSLLENMAQEPLANSPISGKTSLGGMQGKIVLAKKGDSWHRVHYGYPSTHILKPVAPEYPTMIFDEAFCMQLALKLGLTTHPVWIEDFDGLSALVIERFDRDKNIPLGRIHQEDFNQVLGASGDQKYQEIGGKVSAKRMAQTLMHFGSDEDVRVFASQLVFAVAIGNLDMHAKNISIFHHPDSTISMTPTYDQVPLRHLNTDGKMALAMNGEYVHANITRTKIVSELRSWKSPSFPSDKTADQFVEEVLISCREALGSLTLDNRANNSLKESIASFINNLLSGKPAGKCM
ncbi:MAG: HipA domain-containing protein [Coriobacteriales bacterium]|jgi:serine/threonine-protein kinase HipA|nr:HipA domain-containing protein [Coriobacteriales bacterium]